MNTEEIIKERQREGSRHSGVTMKDIAELAKDLGLPPDEANIGDILEAIFVAMDRIEVFEAFQTKHRLK